MRCRLRADTTAGLSVLRIFTSVQIPPDPSVASAASVLVHRRSFLPGSWSIRFCGWLRLRGINIRAAARESQERDPGKHNMVLDGGGRVVQLGIPSDVVPNVRRDQGRNRQFTARRAWLIASCAFNPTYRLPLQYHSQD